MFRWSRCWLGRKSDSQPVKTRAYDDAVKAGLITRTNFFPIYFQHIQTLVNIPTISQGQWRVVTDPMYLRESFIISSQFKKQADNSNWKPTECSAKW